MRVVIVDDHDLLRMGLHILFQAEADLLIVGEAHDGEEAILVAAQQQPDVILMDLNMPRLDGIDAIQRIKAANAVVRIVVLSVETDHERLQAALDAGAERLLPKTITGHQLLAALRAEEPSS